ncbi:MAG: hypothetical protein MI923_16430 [Phycisphaerales bacterium]|nr:hypothetical protein [Phycisphaerales bacterium]
MSRDRRNPRRATLGRRASERTVLYTKVKWQDESKAGDRVGVLVGISEAGFALLTDSDNTPVLGAMMRLKVGRRRWNKRAQVIRIDAISSDSNCVAAEFEDRTADRLCLEHAGGDRCREE